MTQKEENKIQKNRESNDMDEAPPSELNKIGYKCSECSSSIEILSLNENEIQLKCSNNQHEIKMKIRDYLNKIRNNKDIKLNDQICDKHKQKYLFYCFECNNHLCEECSGEHSYHYKMYLKNIIPNNESITKIRKIIKKNKLKEKNLNKTKEETEHLLNVVLKNSKEKIDKINKDKNKNNDENEIEEIQIINNEYKAELKQLKIEYENKIKLLKIKYKRNINIINNK